MRPKASLMSVPIIHPHRRRSSFHHLTYSSEIFFAPLIQVSSTMVLLYMASFSFLYVRSPTISWLSTRASNCSRHKG